MDSRFRGNDDRGDLIDYWQDSHSGLSIEHIFGKYSLGASSKPAETAFNSPPDPVDFSAAVAPNERK